MTMIKIPDRIEDHPIVPGRCLNCGGPAPDALALFVDSDEEEFCSWFCLAERAASIAACDTILGSGDDEFDRRGWSIEEAP